MTDPIDVLLADLARITDHADRLRRIATARVELDRLDVEYGRIRDAAIRDARTDGRLTWREIGEIFGVSLQRAHEIGTKAQPERTPTP